MGPDRLAALRTFFETAEPQFPTIVALMYRRFFEARPETIRLFKGGMPEQQRQFAAMLWSIVTLTRSSELWPIDAMTGHAPIPAIEKLAMQHAAAGARPEHFETMKAVLARCLHEAFPREFSPPVADALAFVFDVAARATAYSKDLSGPSRIIRKAIEDP